jgi:serine protease Do
LSLTLLTASLAVVGCGWQANTAQAQPMPARVAPPPASAPTGQPVNVSTLTTPSDLVPNMPSLAPLVESVKAAVVNVDVESREKASALSSSDESPFFFFGPNGGRHGGLPQQAPVRQGAGSGFIIDPHGLVLTNNHVIEGAISIKVHLDDGRSFDGEVLGHDPLTDVALVKLKGDVGNLPSVKLGNSDQMRVGDWVLAIGNPFGLASSVSAGILSAKARDIHAGPYDDFLQTDAAINPGNSGGPLFNLRGEVVGINTAIVGGSSGIGFAVPSNMVEELLPQLEKGKVRRGWLGISIQDMNPDLAQALHAPVQKGALVADVTSGTPAQKAGLQPNDIIVSLDGKPVDSSKGLTHAIGLKMPGTTSTLEYYRQGSKHSTQVVLGNRPNLEARNESGSGDEGSGGDEGDSDEGKTDSNPLAAQGKIGLGIRDNDEVVEKGSGRHGGQAAPIPGALITSVAPDSPAAKADLKQGMVVTEVGGQPITGAKDLASAVKEAKSGSMLLLRVEVEGAGKVYRALRVP